MNTRRAALLLLVLAAFCLAAGCSTDTGSPGGSPLPRGETDTATVTRTIDGDTVHLSFSDGRTETLRILGIDTPEMTLEGNDPGKFSGITDLEYLSIWGEEAAAYTNEKLTGKVVTISYDPAAGSRDTYGRLLATIILPDGVRRVAVDDRFTSLAGNFAFFESMPNAATDDLACISTVKAGVGKTRAPWTV